MLDDTWEDRWTPDAALPPGDAWPAATRWDSDPVGAWPRADAIGAAAEGVHRNRTDS